ncbi:glycosyltransferase family 2 protein [Aestuariivivens sediminicola]|uniref:glycosyltransferase family 2 protein n=1 Tax=Aestuariivivens sediminicola TaxID=2913560 RepID=UPI001F5886D5|nr:glycosyltransferase [Aestuariivivens sediminicola]
MGNKVSIVIPSYNRADLIGETLNSIIAQTYTNWECIVVDDGSIDNTFKVVEDFCKKDDRIKIVKRPRLKPKGANACRNYGLKISNGDYINWFDSDDLMHKNKIELQLSKLIESKTNFCVCKTAKFQNSPSNIIDILRTYPTSNDVFEKFLMKKNIWLTQAPLFKKEFLINFGLKFDEDLQAAQEWEFFSRVLHYDKDYCFVNQELVFFRNHEESMSGQKNANVLWNYFLARKKIYTLFGNDLSFKAQSYFFNYFTDSYYNMLNENDYIKAKAVFKYTKKLFNLSFSGKCYLKLAYVSYKCFGKGYLIIKQV